MLDQRDKLFPEGRKINVLLYIYNLAVTSAVNIALPVQHRFMLTGQYCAVREIVGLFI